MNCLREKDVILMMKSKSANGSMQTDVTWSS